MALQERQSEFDVMKIDAQSGKLSVAEVFDAMRNKRITERECGEILTILEMRSAPLWKRLITA